MEGRTEVTLSLPAYGSVFVVFPKEDSGAEIVEPTLVTPVVLKITNGQSISRKYIKALLVLFFLIEVGRRISR